MNSKTVRVTAILLVTILAASPQVVSAASNKESKQSARSSEAKNATLAWKVGLGRNMSATLTHMDVWQQNGSHVAVFTLNYKNGGVSSARLLSYFPKVVHPGGGVTAANPITRDLTKKKVEPGQSLSVTYYARINQSSLSGIKLAMDVWNPKVKGYLQRVGAYRLPSNYSPAAASGKSAKVDLGGTPLTIHTESFNIIKYNGKVAAKVGLNITNHGGKAWTDKDFDPYLVTGSGTSFPLQREAVTPIQPKEKKMVYYITEIPPYLKTAGMRFLWTENDETLKLTLPAASFKLPASAAPKWDVAPGAAKNLTIRGNRVDARIRQAYLRASGDQALWNIEMIFKNKGNKPIEVPAYEYAIKASEGSFYPYVPDEKKVLSLRPGEEKTLSMEISLPVHLKQDKLKLQMIEPSGAGLATKPPANPDEPGSSPAAELPDKMILPLAYFKIPYQTERITSIGVEYPAQSAKGFAYTLESIQRLPWQDTDLIVAKLRLRNTQELNSLPLPELKVNVKADERVVLAGSEIIANETGSLIAPGEAAEVYVMARTPYTKEIRSLRFELFTQKETAAAKETFLTLTTPGTTQSIEVLEKGKPYSIPVSGKRADAEERRTVIYEGVDSDIIYSQLTLTSGEQRRVHAARLKGYFQSPDGKIYEADTIQPETALQPGAKQSVVFWARVPKGEAGEMGLALGTAMSGGKLAEPGKEITGVLGVKKLMLNPVKPGASSNLSQLSWFPYSVSVTKAAGHLQEGSVTINLSVTFDVRRSEGITAADAGHKLILIIHDTLGQTHERTLTPGTDIQIPGTRTATFELTDEHYKKLRGGVLNLTLVDEFENERITLGSQSYNLSVQLNEEKPNE